MEITPADRPLGYGPFPAVAVAVARSRSTTLPFSINQRLLDDVVIVSDADIAAAVSACFTRLRTVIEPSGAVALAAVVAGRVRARYGRIAVVLSGGNVDWATLRALLAAGIPRRDPR